VICLDANVAVKLLLPEDYSDQARALMAAATVANDTIVVPVLLLSEVTNILRQRMRRGELTGERAQALLALFLALPFSVVSTTDLYHQALATAESYGIPSGYDAQYVALAQQTGSTLWTADSRLVNTLAGRLPFVQYIATYPLPPAPVEPS
jgi:predicted nucleic acid-binding protein